MIRIFADGRKVLEIFENFRVDDTLLKHRRPESEGVEEFNKAAYGTPPQQDAVGENMTSREFDLRFRGGRGQTRGR